MLASFGGCKEDNGALGVREILSRRHYGNFSPANALASARAIGTLRACMVSNT
jgi:hypothetical protein